MTDKEKIKAEIERRKNQFVSQAESFHKIGMEDKESYYAALASNMNSLSCFLDTLEEEPVSNDLEAEFVLYLKHKFNIPQEGNTLKTNGWNPSPYNILDIAKHFAQWQKEQILGDDNKQYHRLRHETLKRLYENEAKLELMVDNALEGYIEKYEQIGGHNYLSLKIPMLSKPDDCKDGDKIKLIIIKEE